MDNTNKIVKISTDCANDIRVLFDILKTHLSNLSLTFSQKGIKMTGQNGYRTILVFVRLNSENFYNYHIDSDNDSDNDISVNIELDKAFYEFTKSIKRDDCLTLSIDEDKPRLIAFDLNSESRNCHYEHKLINIDHPNVFPPEMTFEFCVSMPTTVFKNTLTKLKKNYGLVEIICIKDAIIFSCRNELGKEDIMLKNSSEVKFHKNPINDSIDNNYTVAMCTYDLKELSSFTSCDRLSNDVTLYLKKDHPLFIQFPVASLGKMTVGFTPIIIDENDQEDQEDQEEDAGPIIDDEEQIAQENMQTCLITQEYNLFNIMYKILEHGCLNFGYLWTYVKNTIC